MVSTFVPKGYSQLSDGERYAILQNQIDQVGMKETFSDFSKIARYRTNTASGATYSHDLNLLMASLLPLDCPDNYIFSVLVNRCIKDTRKNRETQTAIKADLQKLPIIFREAKQKSKPRGKVKVTKAISDGGDDGLSQLKSLMLAETFDERHVHFPVMVSIKIDGQRCMRLADRLVSRGLGDIPNIHIKQCLTTLLPSGMDLELCVNHSLRETSSIVRHKTRKIDQLDVYLLDWVKDSDLKHDVPFERRYARLQKWYKSFLRLAQPALCKNIRVHLATQVLVKNKEALQRAYDAAVKAGEEGIMIRDPQGLYVQSRSKALQKWKRWSDTEGKIVDFELATEEGRIKAFIVEWNGARFKISSGLNRALGLTYFKQRAQLKGQLAKFKYQDISRDGLLKKGEAPRHAVFLDIRDKSDL